MFRLIRAQFTLLALVLLIAGCASSVSQNNTINTKLAENYAGTKVFLKFSGSSLMGENWETLITKNWKQIGFDIVSEEHASFKVDFSVEIGVNATHRDAVESAKFFGNVVTSLLTFGIAPIKTEKFLYLTGHVYSRENNNWNLLKTYKVTEVLACSQSPVMTSNNSFGKCNDDINWGKIYSQLNGSFLTKVSEEYIFDE